LAKQWLEMVVEWTFRPVANFGDQSLVQQSKQQAFKAYCPNIYNVSAGQPNVKNVTLVSPLMET